LVHLGGGGLEVLGRLGRAPRRAEAAEAEGPSAKGKGEIRHSGGLLPVGAGDHHGDQRVQAGAGGLGDASGGSNGVLETDGFVLLPDDPQGTAAPSTTYECTLGPASKHDSATDFYFASQANDRFALVSGYSTSDDAAAVTSDRSEIVIYPGLQLAECTNNPPNPIRDLAVAIYFQN
jgi:hypothetical protein